jgi:hypothetical protein
MQGDVELKPVVGLEWRCSQLEHGKARENLEAECFVITVQSVKKLAMACRARVRFPADADMLKLTEETTRLILNGCRDIEL